MAIDMVKEYFKQFGLADKVMELPVSSATVELAAQALGVENARIAKTMSFKKEDGCILVITAGDVKIDNAKYKHAFGLKAKMLTPKEFNEILMKDSIQKTNLHLIISLIIFNKKAFQKFERL